MLNFEMLYDITLYIITFILNNCKCLKRINFKINHIVVQNANFIKTIDILYQTFYNYKVNVFVMGVLCPDDRKASGLNKFIRRIKGAKS